MSSPSIARAIDLAKRAEHCRRTGQPRMAALYEKNLRQALRKVEKEVRAARIQSNPFRAFQYLGQDLVEGIGAIAEGLAAVVESIADAVTTVQSTRQSDFALGGPLPDLAPIHQRRSKK
ncbi:hypothetical protein [Glutamicibacter arilaitensis]|uniref:hypothetical protein n=1 Tax=Glutamicibacter arilaitensis TaxID=256701 RepID=UPI003F8EFD38